MARNQSLVFTVLVGTYVFALVDCGGSSVDRGDTSITGGTPSSGTRTAHGGSGGTESLGGYTSSSTTRPFGDTSTSAGGHTSSVAVSTTATSGGTGSSSTSSSTLAHGGTSEPSLGGQGASTTVGGALNTGNTTGGTTTTGTGGLGGTIGLGGAGGFAGTTYFGMSGTQGYSFAGSAGVAAIFAYCDRPSEQTCCAICENELNTAVWVNEDGQTISCIEASCTWSCYQTYIRFRGYDTDCLAREPWTCTLGTNGYRPKSPAVCKK